MAGALLLLPPELGFWRKALVVTMSVGLGFQVAQAWMLSRQGGRISLPQWLECVPFLLGMGAALLLPAFSGWLLVAAAVLWRLGLVLRGQNQK